MAFYHLHALKSLVMTGGNCSVTEFSRAFIGLQNTKIQKLILSGMHRRIPNCNACFQDMVYLNDSVCEDLALPNLEELQLDLTGNLWHQL